MVLVLISLHMADETSALIEHNETWTLWTGDGKVVVRDETIICYRGVYIDLGGDLTIINCTLLVNTTTSTSLMVNRFYVSESGKFAAVDSTIRAEPGTMAMKIRGRCTFDGSTIEGISGFRDDDGIRMEGASMVFRNSTVRRCDGQAFWVRGSLVLSDCRVDQVNGTFFNIMGGKYGKVEADIINCIFDGGVPTSEPANVCMDYQGNGNVADIRVNVKGTTFKNFHEAIHVELYGTGDHSMGVRDCMFTSCTNGIDLMLDGGEAQLSNNTFAKLGDRTGSAIRSLFVRRATLNIDNATVNNYNNAIILELKVWSDPYQMVLDGLNVTECNRGLWAIAMSTTSKISIIVRHSSFISNSLSFKAENYTLIRIVETVHIPGDGQNSVTDSTIQATVVLDIRTVMWRNGYIFDEGTLRFEDERGRYVTSMDIGTPAPLSIIGWQKSTAGNVNRTSLYPVTYEDTTPFKGDAYNIWTDTHHIIEIVDDRPPIVKINGPLAYQGFTKNSVNASGSIDERGSGLDRLEWSLNGRAFTELPTVNNRSWDLAFDDLAEGIHNLSVRAWDLVGNMGEEQHVYFEIDTIEPVLVLDPIPSMVNMSEVVITGRTEAGAELTINSFPVIVSDGAFEHNVHLDEGSNSVVVVAMDSLGNTNSTVLNITMDTVPPIIHLESPVNGSWTTEPTVELRGSVENGSSLYIAGVEVDYILSNFKHQVSLIEGANEFIIEAVDEVFNSVTIVTVVNADWTPPEIIIDNPETEETHTNAAYLEISGKVEDDNLASMSVNGEPLATVDGSFSVIQMLAEGENEVTIEAIDIVGLRGSVTLWIVLDTARPSMILNVSSPTGTIKEVQGSLVTNRPEVEIRVIADEPCYLRLNDGNETDLVVDHTFELDLDVGPNSISIIPTDAAGNLGDVGVVSIFLDIVPPEIKLNSDSTGVVTENETYLVWVRTEVGAKVSINGEEIDVPPDGMISYTANLSMGYNMFDIIAEDPVGNTNSTLLTIKRVEDNDGGGDDQDGDGDFLYFYGIITMAVIIIVSIAGFWWLRRGKDQEDR